MKIKVFLIVCLLSVPPLSISGSGQPESAPVLLGYLRVENPERMIRDLEAFLAAVDLPFPVGGVIRMGLGELIANPGLSGVDLSRPLILAGFRPDRPDSWAVSLGLPAPEAYYRTLARNREVTFRDEQTGLRVYSSRDRVFDAEAFQAASPEERIDVDSFYRPEEQTLAVAAADKRAWISLDPDLLRSVISLTPDDFPAPAAGHLAVSLQVAPLLEFAEESLEPDFDSSAPGVAVLGPAAVREANRQYLKLFFHYARQLESVSLGINLDGNGVKLEKVLRARPGSPLAEFLSVQKKEELSLFGYLDPAPWLAVGGRIEKAEMTLDFYRRFSRLSQETFAEAVREKGLDPATIWRRRAEQYEDYLLRVAGDEMAFSLTSSSGEFFSVFSIQEIRDREAFREYVRKSLLDDRDSLIPYYEALGITMDVSGIENPRLYRGTEVFTARMTRDRDRIRELVSADHDLPDLPDGPLVAQYAARGSLAVTEFSWGGEPDLRARLDQIAAGKSSFDTSRLGPRREEVNGVIYFSLNRFLEDFLNPLWNNMGSGEEAGIDPGLLTALGDLDLPMVIYLTIEDRELKAATEIPGERIRAVKAAIETLEAGK